MNNFIVDQIVHIYFIAVLYMNNLIIDQFKLLTKQIKFDIDFTTGKKQMVNMYRLSAIQKVLKILEKYPDKITSASQLTNIKNIGKKSLERIGEILKTGKLSEIVINEDIDKYLNIINELEDVIGIGRKKAYDLFKNHNITSVADLKEKYDAGKINLSDNILKGLRYVDKIITKIPREEIDHLNDILTQTTLSIDPKLFGVICGSYRRQSQVSNDVDIVVVHTDMKTNNDIKEHNYLSRLIGSLKSQNIIIDSLTSDDVPTKYMGIFKLENNPYRRIDIRYVAYDSFYSAILYFTGSKDFNKKMRQLAVNMKYTLNEYGLYDENNKQILVRSEKDIFDALSMEYITPDKR